MYQPGFGLVGLAIGGKSLFEGYGKARNTTLIGWQDDATFAFANEPKKKRGKGIPAANGTARKTGAPKLVPGDKFDITIEVSGPPAGPATLKATFSSGGKTVTLQRTKVPRRQTDGFIGVAGRGLIDFEINKIDVDPGENEPLEVGHADCSACYPLGIRSGKSRGSGA